MNKRQFLKGMAGAWLIAPVTSLLHPAWGEISVFPDAKKKRILIQESPVAGYQYHEGERLWVRLAIRQSLQLTRESRNPYDQRAVRVDWHGHKLGYIPRIENTMISQMLDRGETLTARIIGLRTDPNPWLRIRIAIELAI